METKTNKATGEGKTMNGYELGTIVWFHGYEYVIIDEPFQFHGGMMQRARRYKNGDPNQYTIVVPTPEQKALDLAKRKQEYADQQAGFSRLKELKS